MTSTANQDHDGEPAGRGALRPRARLLRTLGSDLISSDKVALIELVKNSYDADASVVLIRFRGPLKAGEGSIEVWDDGHGMDAATLQTSWLDIATDTKRRKPHSDSGRRVLGEKGIGRLAAARLGEEMLLTTRKQNAAEVKLLIEPFADRNRSGLPCVHPAIVTRGSDDKEGAKTNECDRPRCGDKHPALPAVRFRLDIRGPKRLTWAGRCDRRSCVAVHARRLTSGTTFRAELARHRHLELTRRTIHGGRLIHDSPSPSV